MQLKRLALLSIVCGLLPAIELCAQARAISDTVQSVRPDSLHTQVLQDVIVTALGVKQAKRNVGYSTQQVAGDELTRSREVNIVSALSSKVAGLQVTSSAGTPGASAYIKLRGAQSMLGKADNAIASNGDPLWVIDGVPVDNSQFTYRGNAISDLKDVAFSNRAIDLNPDEIETIDVLKGPAATILYGSRASGGAIIVTTKKGNNGALRLAYSGSLSVDVVNKLPELQSTYAQGYNGQYNSLHRNSWGPSFDSIRYDAADKIVAYNNPSATARRVTPFDNTGSFFQPGITVNNGLSFSGGNAASTFLASVGNLTQTGVVPGSDFRRTAIRMSGSTGTQRLKISGSAAYTASGGTRFQQGSNESAVMVGLLRTPPSYDDAAGDKNRDGTQRSYSSAYDNPYFTIHENPFSDKVNRLNGYVSASYDATEWLTVLYRAGTDIYSEQRKQVFAIGGRRYPMGQVYDDEHNYHEVNSDLLVTLHHSFFKDIGSSLLIGYNYNQRNYHNLFSQGDGLTIPGYYNLNNATTIISKEYSENIRTNGLFAQLKLDYKKLLFAELSVRRDQASTFGEAKDYFFYPGVNSSFIFSDALRIPQDILQLGKLRLAYAQAGKEPPAYKTSTNYGAPLLGGGYISPIEFPFGGVNGFALQTTGGNAALQPEVTSSYEGGFELVTLARRLNLDVTLYKATTRNQIIPVSISSTSGLSAIYGNAGAIENKGVEVIAKGRIIQGKTFRWNTSVNFSRNRNTVLSLADGLEGVSISSNFSTIKTRNIAGQPYGVFYGTRWLRNSDGKMIIDDNPASPNHGYPKMDTAQGVIGNPNPDWMGSISNELSYKSWSLSFLIDAKQGGDVWNGTRGVLNDFGVGKETEDRARTKVFDGVKASNGKPNDINATLNQQWYQGPGSGFNGPAEQFVEDGSWLRLREVTLSWALPSSLLRRARISSASLALYGRNLLLLTHYKGIDPETNLKGADPGQGFDYFNMPGTKSYGLALRLSL